MKTIKILGFSLAGVIFLLLIIPLFIDGKYSIEREVTIQRPLEEVFGYIKYLKNQDNFSVWAKIDPNMKKEYTGTDGTVGFVSAWDSENKDAGKGEQKIVTLIENKQIDYELHFIKPFESTDQAYMTTAALNDSVTTVTWGMKGEMKYPMNMMLLFMDMEKMLAPDFEKWAFKS